MALPSITDKEIEGYLASQQRALHIPGLCVGVAEADRPARTWSFGYANLELDVPTTADTVFKLGSLSKHIVAAGVMLLHQDGLIDLNGSLTTYLPHLPEEWCEITVQQLLTHTSGLRRDPARQQFQIVGSLRSTVCDPGNFHLETSPGESWCYSNLGYFLLGHLLERVTGQSFSEFFHHRVFRTLGMGNTHTTSVTKIIKNRASSYYPADDGILNAGDLRQFRPSGAFVSTVSDLLIWDRSLRNATLLSRESIDRIATPAQVANGETYPYGFGWYVLPGDRDTLLYHAGGLWSFRSHYLFCMRSGLSIVILANYRETDVARLTSGLLPFLAPELCPAWAEATLIARGLSPVRAVI